MTNLSVYIDCDQPVSVHGLHLDYSLDSLQLTQTFPPIFPAIFSELIFMRKGSSGESPGKLSQLFLIVKEVAVVLFSVQDIAMWLDRTRLTGKVSLEWDRGLHVVISI